MTYNHENKNSGFMKSRVTGVAAGAVLGLIVVAGIVVVIWNGVGSSEEKAPTPVPTTAAATTSIPPEALSICGLPGYETDGTLDNLPVVDAWDFVGVVQVPAASATAGPGLTDANGYRSCFAHTIDGAVLAAATYFGDTTSAELILPMAQKAIVPGPGQTATLERLGYGQTSTGAVSRLTISGVRVMSYTGDRAVVDLAVTADTGDLFGEVFTLAWTDGDWKIVLTDQGQPPVPVTSLTSLSGYTPWGAE
jgi:hypothetical protein